jgi:hypothetical protein
MKEGGENLEPAEASSARALLSVQELQVVVCSAAQ